MPHQKKVRTIFPFTVIIKYFLLTNHRHYLVKCQSVPCRSLADYVDPKYQNNLDVFLQGGDVTGDLSVLFDVPRMPIPAGGNNAVKLCMEDIPIPTSIGGTTCDGWNKCWLIIGRRSGTDLNTDDTKYCENSDDSYRGTSPCYDCTCSGSDFGSGSVDNSQTLINGCGLSAQNIWGKSCPDVYNGRLVYPYTGTSPESYSNHSSIQINICNGKDDCQICNGGGYQPQFRVGLQWSNSAEQCYNDQPFTTSGVSSIGSRAYASSITSSLLGMILFFLQLL